jgi:hypothetical protein
MLLHFNWDMPLQFTLVKDRWVKLVKLVKPSTLNNTKYNKHAFILCFKVPWLLVDDYLLP